MKDSSPVPRSLPFLQFPPGMLRPKRLVRQQKEHAHILLFRIPPEVLLIVLKDSGLDVYDRASLALTCRTMALTISGEPDLLNSTQELAHGVEEFTREIFRDRDIYSDGTEAMEAWHEEEQLLDRDCNQRADPRELQKFMYRLDVGWNRSERRYCGLCNKFISINEDYWKKKDLSFTYNSDSKIARAWRKGQCAHYDRIELGEDARAYMSRWTKRESDTEKCPCCQVVEWQHCEECNDARGGCCCCF